MLTICDALVDGLLEYPVDVQYRRKKLLCVGFCDKMEDLKIIQRKSVPTDGADLI